MQSHMLQWYTLQTLPSLWQISSPRKWEIWDSNSLLGTFRLQGVTSVNVQSDSVVLLYITDKMAMITSSQMYRRLIWSTTQKSQILVASLTIKRWQTGPDNAAASVVQNSLCLSSAVSVLNAVESWQWSYCTSQQEHNVTAPHCAVQVAIIMDTAL